MWYFSWILGLGLAHLLRALGGLFGDGVDEAHLHVEDDSLLLEREQVLQQVGWSLGLPQHFRPDAHPHLSGLDVLPAKEGGAGLGVLLYQADGQQAERMTADLGQHFLGELLQTDLQRLALLS